MWILNNGSTFISGHLEALLKEAAFLMMCDIGYDGGSAPVELSEDKSFKCRYNTVFSRMSLQEQVYAVHFVLDHIFDEKKKAPALKMWMESAIDMLFNRVERSLKRACKTRGYDIRKLVIDAYRDHYRKDEMVELGLDEQELDDLHFAENAHRFQDIEFWLGVTEDLREVILLDRDFEMVETLEGMDDDKREMVCQFLRIDLDGKAMPAALIEQRLRTARGRREVMGLVGKIAGM